MMKTHTLPLASFLLVGLSTCANAHMGPWGWHHHGPHGMMHRSDDAPCAGYGPMYQMHRNDIELKVENTDTGVQITWSSTDPKIREDLQQMAQHMLEMHRTQKPTEPEKNQTPTE